MARRRVGFIQSFKMAGKTAADTSGGGTDAGLWAMLTVGLWWWIAGVPEEPSSEDGPTEEPADSGSD